MPGDYHYGWLSAGLHLSGSNGSTSFPDVKGHSFSRTGTVAISTAQSRFASEGSAYFAGGTYDLMSCPASSDFSFGDAFSISFSAYVTALPTSDRTCLVVRVGQTNSIEQVFVHIRQDGSFGAHSYDGYNNNLFTNAGIVSVGVWMDFEISVFNGLAFIFKNGALIASRSGFTMPHQGINGGIYLGGDDGGGAYNTARLNGYLSELRVMCRSGRNAGAYTPNTGPFAETLELHAIAKPEVGKAVSATVPGARSVLLDTMRKGVDMEHGGHGRIIGTTQNAGTPDYPVARRVRLFRKRDGVLARETWSDAAGNYAFNNLRDDIAYVVTSHDHTGLYNAVIADSITPEPMP